MKISQNSFNVLLKKENKKPSQHNLDYINLTKNYLIIDNVIDGLKKIPDKSISTVVTSPPYWNLRDYKSENQIGNEKNPALFIYKLVQVGKELLRILKDDGAYFLNIGDTYINQSLQMIPQKIAIGMQEQGWLIRNQIIWYKPNHMPSPIKSRFSNTYEIIYFFTKNDWEKKVYFDIDQIRVPHTSNFNEQKYTSNTSSKFIDETKNLGASPIARLISKRQECYTIKRKIKVSKQEIGKYLSDFLEQNNITKAELIKILGIKNYKHKVGHWFRNDAGASYPSKEDWLKLKKILKFNSKYDKQMITEYKELQTIKAHPKGKNPGDLFISNTAKSKYKHYAVFPESIPELAIKSTCPLDGVVLDPFAGTGTTGVVAERMKRRFILIDIQKEFSSIILERIKEIEVL